jgi:septal ring factor EnvC (AmiA/AmiB activator)
MSRKRIRSLLSELEREVSRSGKTDEQSRELIAALDARLNREEDAEDESLSDAARELESRFAAKHPVAERMAREIADLLAKMGI